MSTDFLTVLNQIKNIKKLETSLPIAQKAANIVPLMVGDDLSLRSSITSPSGYDREIIKLLHSKVEFIHDTKTYSETYDKFCSQISNIDKLVLLWSLYKCTYESLGSRKLTCPKCKDNNDNSFPFSDEILVEDLLHPDSLTQWEEKTPFYEYVFKITIPYDKMTFVFSTMIPTIAKYNLVLGMVSTGELQNNLDKLGQVFSKSMQLSLLTTQIEIINEKKESAFGKNIQEIMMAFDGQIPEVVSEVFYESYNNKFDKYLPNFYKMISCPNCGHQFKHTVDIETEFFRRSVLGKESGE